MPKKSTIELYNINFSVGHFTMFSPTHRENLHGHDYSIYLAIHTQIFEKGLSFDFRFYRSKLEKMCALLDHSVLIPTASNYLQIDEQDEHYCLSFHTEKLFFLKRDVTLLPVTNITVEELAHWFLKQLLIDTDELQQHYVEGLTVKVASSPGQSGSAEWKRDSALR